ncbi:hypothetical protein [Puniceibacterium confluentis]|nr:hypothetical protein [Puniceibacterium confluentis]
MSDARPARNSPSVSAATATGHELCQPEAGSAPAPDPPHRAAPISTDGDLRLRAPPRTPPDR